MPIPLIGKQQPDPTQVAEQLTKGVMDALGPELDKLQTKLQVLEDRLGYVEGIANTNALKIEQLETR